MLKTNEGASVTISGSLDAALTGTAERPLAVVLAAGRGARMGSDLPKVLFEAAGKTLVRWVLDTLTAAGIDQQIVVVGYEAELVRRSLENVTGVVFVTQQEQRGTGDAVAAAAGLIAQQCVVLPASDASYDPEQASNPADATSSRRPIVIVCGDSPMLRAQSVAELLQQFAARRASCLLGTAVATDPRGLGRIVRNKAGGFEKIVEEKDATPAEREICEVNMSTYVFAAGDLLRALSRLKNKNASGEYYLTDCPGLLLAEGCVVDAVACLDLSETLSVNTPDQLAAVAAALNLRFGEATGPDGPEPFHRSSF